MTNPTLTRISDAHQNKYLCAAFIDCQKAEYISIEDKTSFIIARDFAHSLRKNNVPISHFLFDQSNPKSLQPFIYKGAQQHAFPNRLMDFEGVIPTEDEWVYPKETYNGFTNPFSKDVVGNVDRNPSPNQASVLLCGGFTARCCLMETALGSFKKAANPEKHAVVIALDATNLHPPLYKEYIADFLAKAGSSIKDKIGFALTEEIIDALAYKTTPSQSSPHPSCRV